MRRFAPLFVALALAAAACGGGGDPSVMDPGATRALAYSLTGDVASGYHVAMDTTVSTDIGGALAATMGGTMTMAMDMEFDAAYHVGAGPDPGTYRVELGVSNMRLNSGSVKVAGDTVDFAELDPGEIRAALDAQAADMAYVIDEQGRLLAVEIDGESIDLGGVFSGMSPMGSQDLFFGPELPGDEVAVGDSWETTSEQSLPGLDPIRTDLTHEVMRAEERNGRDTWLIKTESSTAAYTLTWDDLMAMAAALGGVGQLGLGDEVPAAFRFSMRSAPASATIYTWFDPVLGMTVAQETMSGLGIHIEMTGLPGTQGRVSSMDMDGATHVVMDLTS
jgi:hypothetical protein